MEIIIIAAMTPSHVIGHKNSIPWHIPSEQCFFKHVTMGSPIIMGRKTFESIGRPLPGRQNIIITSKKKGLSAGCLFVPSLEQALSYCTQHRRSFIIGGAQVYKEAMDKADALLITLIEQNFQGDTFFPDIPSKRFQVVGMAKSIGPITYTIIKYQKIK
ncbi:dihydrofolate reductase [Desulfogranum marinum]|uniref:dihydrofolate reductase n=1 Tax=Desulfogranum marinum TaxID=453220 RepID=UPI0019664CBB|nr:dihydrofolate reductase [Desulfogranum marinum]MBM9512678.1 dihydrofolate reductase [Desulfogranum marinum]